MTTSALQSNHLTNAIVHVEDGAEALDYLYRRGKYAGAEHPLPVLILLDLKMPKVDGLEVLRAVKSDPVLKAIPVVILTSSREEQDVVKSYQLGVNAYVVKPVGFPEFVAAIKQIGAFWTVHNEPPPTMRASPG
jgi:CheY-like chemotaxis protein